MGKLRLKLQAMMPSVWYRRLKMELRMRVGGSPHQQGAINYKRWSSQRKQLGSSRKQLLIKGSPLPSSTLSPISASFSQLEERESLTSPSSLPEERECLSHTSHTIAPSIEQREAHFASAKTQLVANWEQGEIQYFANSATHSANPAPPALEQPPCASETQSLQDRVSETREPLSKAPCIDTPLPPVQAPSLSTPLPLSDKNFQLNLRELNSKLNNLSYDQRRTYYSSPLFAAPSPAPVFDKLDLDLMVKNSIEPHDESLVARKLFPEEDKLFTNEASRSSNYIGSTSFTGQSNTSSEDTAFDKASSSSVWERDFSSLPSEGSELFPAMEKIRNTVTFLRRKSRKARKDASSKQRRGQKDARGKFPHALEEYDHFDANIHSFDHLCQLGAQEKVPSIEKLKVALAGSRAFYGLHSPLADEVHGMEAQSVNSLNAKLRQEGDDFLRHRRSVSNESLFLETISLNQAFNRRSPWAHNVDAGFDKFSPSDSAFSDSELESCRSHRSKALPERYGSIDEHRRRPPKQGFYFDKDITNLSPFYNEACSEFVLPAWRQHPANLPHPSLSKSKGTYRSLHSGICNGSKKSSNRESFDANHCFSPSFKSKGGYGWAPPCDHHSRAKSLLSESIKSGLNTASPSPRTDTRRAFIGSSYDNQCKGCSRSFNTRGASPETSNKSKVFKDVSTISSDNDDYDGDVSIRSYNDRCMESVGKSHRKLRDQLDGKDCDVVPMFSRSSSTRTSQAFVCQSWVPPISKSGSKQSNLNDDYESLQGIISVPSWSRMYSKGEEGYGKESGIVASPSKSPGSLNTSKQDYAKEERMSESMRSKEGQKDGNESIQSDGKVACTWARSPTSTREADGEDYTVSIATLIEREMGERDAVGAMLSKSCSRREQLNGGETRVEVQGGKGKEGKEGKNERGGLNVSNDGSNKEEVDAREDQCVEKSKVYESFAMVKCSSNPSQDFKESMMEMVLHKKLHESLDLVELLQCYLSLNSPRYHDLIVKAFIDLWSDLFRPSI